MSLQDDTACSKKKIVYAKNDNVNHHAVMFDEL